MQRHPEEYKHSIVDDAVTETLSHAVKASSRLMLRWKDYLSSVRPRDFIRSHKCNICLRGDTSKFFSVWGFDYYRCSRCASVFLNPRPKPEFHSRAFYNSPISRIITSEGYQKGMRERFMRFIMPLLEPVFYLVGNTGLTVLEICGRDKNIAEFLISQKSVKKIYRYMPQVPVSGEKFVYAGSFDEIPQRSCDIVLGVLSFESLLEPLEVFREMSKKVKPTGEVVILSRAGSGFDIQVIKGYSRNIFPLEHMNLISIEGYEHLCLKNSLFIRELSTPGLLDTIYVKKQISNVADMEFFKYLFSNRSEEVIGHFQNFLQYAKLSSALRLIASPKQ